MDTFFKYQPYTEITTFLSSFVLGLILAPWSLGIVYVIAIIIFIELFMALCTLLTPPYWYFHIRIGIIFAGIFGYIVGRTIIFDKDPFNLHRHKKKRNRKELFEHIINE
jgi:hypothetical protein